MSREVTPTRSPARPCSRLAKRFASSSIDRTVRSSDRLPVSGRSPYTKRNSSTPYAAAVRRSRRKPSMLRSLALRHAIDRPPISATSCATAMLDTVARPMWLSGIKNDDAARLNTPIWCRTRMRSGRVAGSISHTMPNLRSVIRPAYASRLPQTAGWWSGELMQVRAESVPARLLVGSASTAPVWLLRREQPPRDWPESWRLQRCCRWARS